MTDYSNIKNAADKMVMNAVLHTIATGGSRTGMGYYTSFADSCPLNAALYRSDKRNFLDEKSGAAIGTIGHAFQELYWKRQLDSETLVDRVVEFSQHVDEENRVEATRCFNYFRSVIPESDGLGKVVAVEHQLPEVDDQGNPSVTQAMQLEQLFDRPFTMRVDLVTDLTQRHIDRLRKKRDIDWDGHLGVLKPGRWLWDYKHYGRRDSNLLDKTLGSTQYAAYLEAYNTVSKKKALGLIQCAIFTTKQPGMRMTVVPTPSQKLFEAAWRLVQLGYLRSKESANQTIPSEKNCFSYGGICRWLKEGLCDRTGPTDSGLVQLKAGGFVK